MDLSPQVVRNTRTLLVASGLVVFGFALPFLLGEAAWAFGLLVAPILLLAMLALPVAIWTAGHAIAAVVRGEDPRRWVLVLGVGVLLGSLFLVSVVALRSYPPRS